jgi:hypothetical protein
MKIKPSGGRRGIAVSVKFFGRDTGERHLNEKSGDRREKTLSWLCIQAFPDHQVTERYEG